MAQYYQPPQVVYYGSRYSGCLKFFFYALSCTIPLVGFILALIYATRPDPESKRLGQTCLVLSIISTLIYCCLVVLGIVMGAGGVALLPFMEGNY